MLEVLHNDGIQSFDLIKILPFFLKSRWEFLKFKKIPKFSYCQESKIPYLDITPTRIGGEVFLSFLSINYSDVHPKDESSYFLKEQASFGVRLDFSLWVFFFLNFKNVDSQSLLNQMHKYLNRDCLGFIAFKEVQGGDFYICLKNSVQLPAAKGNSFFNSLALKTAEASLNIFELNFSSLYIKDSQVRNLESIKKEELFEKIFLQGSYF